MKAHHAVNLVMVVGILSLFIVPLLLLIYGQPSAQALLIIGITIITIPTIAGLIGLQAVNLMEECLEKSRERAEILMALVLWLTLILVMAIIFLPRIIKAL